MEQFTFTKRYLFLLFALFLTPFLGISQSHFTPATNNGAGNWHFYTVYANLDGVALVAGDEIAVYDGNVCVGARTLTAALDSSYTLAVGNDFISYEANNGDPGYTGGNTYSFRCWDASASTEYVGSMVYDLTYTPQDYVGANFPSSMEFRWSWVGLSFTAVAPAAGDLDGNITESVSGDDIQGVSVTATGTSTYVTSTDVDGDYLFDNIPPDTYTVSTSHADFVDQSIGSLVVTDGGTTTQNFVLVYKPGSITGTVTDQSANPVDGATVEISGGASTTTNASGVYTLSSVAPGTYSLTASKAGYASSTEAAVVVAANAATTQNFTINAAGILSGTVTDGTNTGGEDGVLVTVVETGDFVTTAGGGLFSFDLSTGTYSLTFSKSGFHDGSASGLAVTAGGTTNADETIFETNWSFTDGDPFSDVWTIYLNTVTGDGLALKEGDEVSVWAPDERGGITKFEGFGTGGNIDAFNRGPSITNGTASNITLINGNTQTQVTLGSGHGFVVGDEIEIGSGGTKHFIVHSVIGDDIVINSDVTGDIVGSGWYRYSTIINFNFIDGDLGFVNGDQITILTSEDNAYDGLTITMSAYYYGTVPNDHSYAETSQTCRGIKNAGGSYSEIVSGTTVTSAAHGRSNGESVTISGTTSYDGTWTISNSQTNTYDITATFVADDATGSWVYGEQMVGLYYLDGPISGAGTAHALKAFSVLNDASTGYEVGEDYTFKLFYAGGTELTTLNSTVWTATGGGLTDPGTTFPSGSVFSKVDLDFDLPPGTLEVDFLDEMAAAPLVPLNLELFKAAVSQGTYTYGTGVGTMSVSTTLDAGTYSLSVSGERFADTTYTGITLSPGTTTSLNLVINHFDDETQTINLTSGYQLVSRRVGGDTYDMSDYLGGTMAPTPPTTTNIDMTKDEDGLSDTYPLGDGGVAWDIKRGYNFKMNTADVMVITGTPIKYSADIDIREMAYSMISYLPDYTLDAEVAFADLMTDDLDFIRDGAGNSLTKVGGVWVDHIGNCTPGEGFLIKWDAGSGGSSFTFNYPAQTKSASAAEEASELVHFPFYSGYGNPMKNTYTMYISGDILEVGDEVAAFDGTTLVGATVITSTNQLDNSLVSFEELFDKEGFTQGSPILLKIWKANEDTEYWLNFTNTSDATMYTSSVYPSADGAKSTLEVALSPEGVNDNLAQYINVYPNPSNGLVNISSPEKIDRLTVVNLVGQTVMDFKPESGNAKLNLEGFNSGVYFVNIIIEGQRVTKKLTIQ